MAIQVIERKVRLYTPRPLQSSRGAEVVAEAKPVAPGLLSPGGILASEKA